MPAFMDLPVRNTFVHFSEDDDEEQLPVRRTKSDQVTSARPLVACPARRKLALAELRMPRGDAASSSRDDSSRPPTPKLERHDSRESTSVGSFSDCHSDLDETGKLDGTFAIGKCCSGGSGCSGQSAWTTSTVTPDSPRGSSPAAPASPKSRQPLHLVPLLWPINLQTHASQQPAERPAPAPQPAAPAAPEQVFVTWEVHNSQVESKNNKVCSEVFLVAIPNCGTYPFQLFLYAEDRVCKGPTGGFHRSRGRGRVELRCQAQLPPGAGKLTVSVSIGNGRFALPAREPVIHDFAQQACCGWRRMDFSQAVNPAASSFDVRVGFAQP